MVGHRAFSFSLVVEQSVQGNMKRKIVSLRKTRPLDSNLKK
ncbi:hypothetical protein PM8797T_31098 [Gimesia maris DSM 8797]|nr:hypothetical protein PM8797T_31098 [Gimesia maris DSM 8797]